MVGKSQASGSDTLQYARPDQSECLKLLQCLEYR